jgi:hypothetical protein
MDNVSRDGHVNGVTFSLVGPPDTVDAIIRFIRRLTVMSGGKY